jgi:pSer/pThr/pTyr-binding forkhead associated (FHA) protein
MCNNVWVLEDMNSTNGTFVNEYPVAAGYPAVIKQGDVIRFGDEEFVMEYMNNFPAGDLNNCPIANVWY